MKRVSTKQAHERQRDNRQLSSGRLTRHCNQAELTGACHCQTWSKIDDKQTGTTFGENVRGGMS